MYYAICTRHEVLDLLPKGGVGCEIGVQQGDNAAAMLQRIDPEKMYLIDPWKPAPWSEMLENEFFSEEGIENWKKFLRQSDPEYDGGDPAPTYERFYHAVCARFEKDARVEIIRKPSLEAAHDFPDEHFDFVYVDGDHSFNGVYRDLLTYEKKLKKGGIIIGNDYIFSDQAKHAHYGVIPACTLFCKNKGYRIAVLTHGEFCDFFLVKGQSEYTTEFLDNLLGSDHAVVELSDSIAANYTGKFFSQNNGKQKFIPSL